MKKHLLFILLAISCGLWAQDKIEELEQFEIRSYAPQKSGVTDLVFEARIDNLTETLSKNLVLGKLVDVSFKIYWLSPSQYKIEVQGLPKGFPEIKADLAALIKGKLEFVLPEKFSDKFKGYTLKAEPIAEGKLIRAIDATYTMAVPEVDIVVDKSGQLKTVETRAPMSAVKTEFFHSPKSWSNNKLVLDKIVLTSKQGAANLTTTNKIDYINVNGIGFPSKVAIKNVSEVTIPATEKVKEKKIKNETGTTIRFTKYEVNTGKAQRYINEGLKR
ncbi:MAG: hypothetical protein ACXVLQ_02785 [Bacteriovorax sp.]